MKKIIIILSILIISVIAVTWLYFANISSGESSTERVLNVIPSDASLVFEYKNEPSFYDIFKNFTLFKDILGENNIEHLSALKTIFVDDELLNQGFAQSELYFSIHKTIKNNADILIVAPLSKDFRRENSAELISILQSKYKLDQQDNLYKISFSNKSTFFFTISKSLLIGSFEEELIKNAIKKTENPSDETSFSKSNLTNTRNKNAIANLYINYANLHQLFSNFSKRNNPSETVGLKSFEGFSALTINYQTNAFMFSGLTHVKDNKKNYINIFLNQEPGTSTLMNILPFDAASYTFYFTSNQAKFKTDLDQLLAVRNEAKMKKDQLANITQRHSINIEKEFFPLLGNEFGTIQLASGDKLGIIKTNNVNRLSFILSAISSESLDAIRHFDDSNLLYYSLGDPFKSFKRPYYAFIENHLVVSNNLGALRRFLRNYEQQEFLNRTERNIDFQQYLSNNGNIFYFIHKSNAKSIIRTYLSRDAYQKYSGEDFNWKNIYGLSIQFSADKDKFFTNFYMSKIPEENKLNSEEEALALDSLLQ